jgi:hypothetical protein
MSPWSERFERARPNLVALPAVALVAIALWEIVAVARAGCGVPSRGDWEAASAALREQRAPGELIAVAPGWLDPVLRMHLGDAMSLEQVARLDDARYAVVWELSARGAAAPERRGREPGETLELGDLELTPWRREPARVATDFLEAAATAELNGRVRGPRIVSLEEVGFEPRRCIKLVPRPDQTVEVRFARASLGTELVVGAGLADIFTRRDLREPGRLAISIDGAEVARVELGVEDGWILTRIPTSRKVADVVFTATAAAPDRRICFAAEARTP